MKLVHRLCASVLVILLVADCGTAVKHLSVVLRSGWPYTPHLLETSEFLWEYEEGLFWKFVNATSLLPAFSSEKEAYEFSVDTVEGLLSPSVYNVYLLSLSLRAYSPSVQMFYQVAEEAYRGSSRPDNCVSSRVFVDVYGRLACNVEDLLDMIKQAASNHRARDPLTYSFDHKFLPQWQLHAPLVILYAELGTNECKLFHSIMSALALQGQVRYIFRHFVKVKPHAYLLLNGYGVKLTVKNTEYKAVDDTKVHGDDVSMVTSADEEEEISGFIMSTLKSRHSSLTSQLKDFNAHLLQGAREMPELKLWQLQDLGFQASQKILQAGPEFGLNVMQDLAQSLPTKAKLLQKVQVDAALRREIQANQLAWAPIGVSAGHSLMILNGIILHNDKIDIFQMLEVLLSESRLLDGLATLGVQSSMQKTLLAMAMHGPAEAQEGKVLVVDVRSDSVIFINNLEKDRRYKSWSRSLREFLRPTYPGMLRQIARNVFHIVFMLDPVSADGAEMLEYMQLFLEHAVPARLGLVLLPKPHDAVGLAICQSFAFIASTLSPLEAFHWLVMTQNLTAAVEHVSVGDITSLYQQLFSKQLSGIDIEQIFDPDKDSYCKAAREFFLAKGFGSLPRALVNGVQLELEDEDLETAVVSRMQQQTYEIQQALFNNQLSDRDDVYKFFLERPGVLQRINRHILARSRLLDLSIPGANVGSTDEPTHEELAGAIAANLYYFMQPEGEFTTKKLSVWVVVDLSSAQGKQMLLQALVYLRRTTDIRVGVVHSGGTSDCLQCRSIQAALAMSTSMSSLITFVQDVIGLPQDRVDVKELAIQASHHNLDAEQLTSLLYCNEVNTTLSEHVLFSSTVLQLRRGQNALLSNGKVVGPLSEGEEFNSADWAMLENMELAAYASSLTSMVEGLQVSGLSADDDTALFRSNLVMKISSLLRSASSKRHLSELPKLFSEHSALHLPASEPDKSLYMVAILDPLSPEVQHLASILQALHSALSLSLTIYFNPVGKLSQMPISSFYRYLLEPKLSFHDNGSLRQDAMVVFSDLPTSPLLTLGLDVPHTWLVEPVFSPYDLDNIHLAEVPEGVVHAVFILEHILVEGQCFDSHSEQPIPGLEFVLGSTDRPDLFDTIVMANLGYFQLKAGPGAWILGLREGRSRDIYSIHSYSAEDGLIHDLEKDTVSINVRSFQGAVLQLKVSKRPGKEEENLLAEDKMPKLEATAATGDSSNLWSTLSSFLKSDEEEDGAEKSNESVSNETINIFSIASGHLYERFMRIMMLSVVKHTSNHVKFWFLKNYLSPTFKDFIPYMAALYGFEVELVEYKWPRWLHAQKEKQRLIWGYKILFLDVLFPLSVKKIIFVDADLIVRADLVQLLMEPLDGAPYAYTPFCDSRPDMKGFRFWDKGYWKSHLGNRPYHISALYVVDLVTFRRLAAGDRLRGQYQALSQDPNSLSNLDQDLPNNMIHSVPIKSLPQDWLWCETWCSLESKPLAKTIDLCNNPLTKEPKLKSAMRIVAEWADYDSEVKTVLEKFRTTVGSAQKTVEGGLRHEEL